MAAGQQGQAEVWRGVDESVVQQAASRGRQRGESSGAPPRLDGPAFISDEAEVRHYLATIADERTDPEARATARMELARLYERRQRYLDAAEQYERNVWAGVRSPATYARLVGAYRALGRDDLAEAALEQIRRNGGVGRANGSAPDRRMRQVAANGARVMATPLPAGPPHHVGGLARRLPTGALALRAFPWRGLVTSQAPGAAIAPAAPERPGRRGARPRRPTLPSPTTGLSTARDAVRTTQRLAEPFLTGQAGQHTRLISTVILPIALGLLIVGFLVMMSRSRTSLPAPAPTAAPVATVAPTPLPTAAIPAALSQPPASARLVVANVGAEGLSLRKAPGTGERIKIWREGTELVDLGQTSNQGGKTWRQARDPEGNVGWAASDFLVDPSARPDPASASASNPAARPTSAGPSFASGGLGLSRQEWEQAHGQPTRTSVFLEYDGGRLIVGLSTDNIWHLQRVWTPRDAVDLETARKEARAFLPADATPTGTIEREGRTVDVYSSASLASRFGPTAWNGGKTGTFSIQYGHRSAEDHRVTSAMFRLGDVAL